VLVLLYSTFRLQEALQEQDDCGYVPQGEYRPIEMRLIVRVGDMPAGNAERDNYNEAGKGEAKPVHRGYFNGPAARVTVENYYSK